MRTTVLLLLALALSACANTGPGADCDPCSADEIPLKALNASGAPSAGASGGQRAYNAPFTDETARMAPRTSIARGQGPASQSSADADHREVASGGAQNAGVLVPTKAEATQTGGGVSAAVQSAADTVASLRAALQLALCDPTVPQDKIAWIGEQLSAAQRDLSAATAAQTVTSVTNNNFQDSRNTITAVSTSKTGSQEAMDPESVKALAEGTVKVVESGTAEYESTFPPAGTAPDSLPSAPVSEPE